MCGLVQVQIQKVTVSSRETIRLVLLSLIFCYPALFCKHCCMTLPLIISQRDLLLLKERQSQGFCHSYTQPYSCRDWEWGEERLSFSLQQVALSLLEKCCERKRNRHGQCNQEFTCSVKQIKIKLNEVKAINIQTTGYITSQHLVRQWVFNWRVASF